MADRLDGKLDPRTIAPSFDRFPSMNAPAPAPLALTHCRQRAHVSVRRNSPSVASTGVPFLSWTKLKHLKIDAPAR